MPAGGGEGSGAHKVRTDPSKTAARGQERGLRPGHRNSEDNVAIPDWTVHEGTAQTVVDNTLEQANDFDGLETSAGSAFEAAIGTCKSALITGALQSTHDEYIGKLITLAKWRGLNVGNEGQKIINAWVNGSETMAVDARNAMDDVVTSDEEAS